LIDEEKIYPNEKLYRAGTKLLIKCLSSNYTNWTLNGNSLPARTVIQHNAIYIKDMTLKDRGIYQCIGINEDGVEFWAVSIAYYISEWSFSREVVGIRPK